MISRSWWSLAIVPIMLGGAPQSRPIDTLPQQPAGAAEVPATSPTALHRAWMLEVLDLDSVSASKAYAAIAADRRPYNLTRWVAAARLAELQRLNIAPNRPRVDFADAPDVLRPKFLEADTTLDIEGLVKRLSAEPNAVLLDIATEAGDVPNLRPIVTDAESWFVEQIGPSRLDRIRRRRRARNDRPPFTDRVFAAWILGDELRGLLERADEKRSIYFILWEPPKPIADPEVALKRFRYNIGKLLAEREWTGGYRRLHYRLKATVEQLAVQDPAAAMALVRRLPQYGERLLTPIPEEER